MAIQTAVAREVALTRVPAALSRRVLAYPDGVVARVTELSAEGHGMRDIARMVQCEFGLTSRPRFDLRDVQVILGDLAVKAERDALIARSDAIYADAAPSAAERVVGLIDSEDERTALAASVEVLDRVGVGAAKEEGAGQTTVNITIEQKDAALKEYRASKMAKFGLVVDTEAEEETE